MGIKIGTLNLFQGLQLKKNIVKETIIFNKIDILCMQETEINPNVDHNLLSLPGSSVEVETNSENSRAAIYVSSKVDYIRRGDLEGTDSNLIIIDLKGSMKLHLINIYRSHSPQHGVSQRNKFNEQLSLIDNAVTNKTLFQLKILFIS